MSEERRETKSEDQELLEGLWHVVQDPTTSEEDRNIARGYIKAIVEEQTH